jgi:dethiobiotin synthetase
MVTGTDTGVGKTVVTAALSSRAVAAHRKVAVIKPVQTGVAPSEPGDLAEVSRLSVATDLHEYARFSEPLAPGTAARRCGVTGPDVEEMAERVLALTDRDIVLIEGAGGPLVELNTWGQTFVDLARALNREVDVEILLVASAGIGVLNLAALTARVLTAAGVPLSGVVLGDWPEEPDLASRCNVLDLPRYAAADLVGVVQSRAGSLDHVQFADRAKAWVAPRFGGIFDAAAFTRTVASLRRK